jgi:hypothetical protein
MNLAKATITTLGLALCSSMATAADSGTRLLTAFEGKPPFKRQIVTAEVADNMARDAAARRSALPAAGDRVHVAQLRARPPFERRIVTVSAENAVEFARFEEVEPRIDSGRRVGPPGKGFR